MTTITNGLLNPKTLVSKTPRVTTNEFIGYACVINN